MGEQEKRFNISPLYTQYRGRGQHGALLRSSDQSSERRIGDASAEMGNNLPVMPIGGDNTAMQVLVDYYIGCALLFDGITARCWYALI